MKQSPAVSNAAQMHAAKMHLFCYFKFTVETGVKSLILVVVRPWQSSLLHPHTSDYMLSCTHASAVLHYKHRHCIFLTALATPTLHASSMRDTQQYIGGHQVHHAMHEMVQRFTCMPERMYKSRLKPTQGFAARTYARALKKNPLAYHPTRLPTHPPTAPLAYLPTAAHDHHVKQ